MAPAEPEQIERPGSPGARAVLVLTLLGAFFVWNSLYFWPYLVDDAFISLRYAENLVRGHGPVYNPGERVEGFSNFSWVLTGAAVLALGLPPVTTLKLLGLACGLGVVLATFALGRRLFAPGRAGTACALGAAAYVALHAALAVWSQAGLETALYALLLLGVALRFERELGDPRARPLSALLFALAWATRPETPVYAVWLVLRRVLALRARPAGRFDAAWLGTLAALLVPYELWGAWYYGHLLPMTWQAKLGDGDPGRVLVLGKLLHQPLLARFWSQQGFGFQVLALLGVSGAALARRRFPPVLGLAPLCGLVFVLYARMDWMPRHRFLVPILAFVGLLVAFGAGEWWRVARRPAARLALAALVVACAVDYARIQVLGGHARRAGDPRGIALRERGVWFGEVPALLGERYYPQEQEALTLLARLPEDAVLCMRDIGFVGFLTMNPIWDTAGLFTPVVARARHDPGPEAFGALVEELRRVRPACIYLVLTDNERPSIDDRIDEWLRTDPAARATWAETTRRGRPTAGESTVLYARRDPPAGDTEDRVERRLARWPEYAERARVNLRQLGRGGRRTER